MTPTYEGAALLLRCTIKAATEAFTLLKRFSVERTCHVSARREQAQALCLYLHLTDIRASARARASSSDQFTIIGVLDGSLRLTFTAHNCFQSTLEVGQASTAHMGMHTAF